MVDAMDENCKGGDEQKIPDKLLGSRTEKQSWFAEVYINIEEMIAGK